MKNLLLRWGPALGLMLAIFVFSAQPKSGLPDFAEHDFSVKKSAHAIIYAVLAVAMLHGVQGQARLGWQRVLAALALTLAYAASDEYHQTFVPGREGRLFDVGVDALGATIGLSLRLWLWPRLEAALLRWYPYLSRSGSNRH